MEESHINYETIETYLSQYNFYYSEWERRKVKVDNLRETIISGANTDAVIHAGAHADRTGNTAIKIHELCCEMAIYCTDAVISLHEIVEHINKVPCETSQEFLMMHYVERLRMCDIIRQTRNNKRTIYRRKEKALNDFYTANKELFL